MNGTPPGTGAIRMAKTDLLFLAYLGLLIFEYVGVARLVSPLQPLRLSTVMAWILSLTMVSRLGLRAITEFPQNRLLFAFLALTGLSMTYGLIQLQAWYAFRNHLDYFGLFLSTAYLIDRATRVDRFAFVFSVIAIVLVGLNLDKIGSSQRVGFFQGAYFLGDGNDFAWGIITMLPFAIYLATCGRGLIRRALGAAAAATAVVAIVGTQSRGATLALGAAGLYYLVRISQRKALAFATVAALVVGILVLAPSYYFDRMRTIEHYEDDGSARKRLVMWGVAIRMATDYPLGVGAGSFSSAYGRLYREATQASGEEYAPDRWLSAHSVYFRALGEYGFPGVALILSILGVNFVTNERSSRALKALPPGDHLQAQWPLLVNMSLVGFAVAGTFLGGLSYPHIYVLSALSVSARRQSQEAAQAPAGEQAPAEPVPLARRHWQPKQTPVRARPADPADTRPLVQNRPVMQGRSRRRS